MSKLFIFLKVACLVCLSFRSHAQDQYLNYQQLTTKLQGLSKYSNVKLESYGKSFGSKDLWALKIGDVSKPALLIVAGLDGSHQAGTQMAVFLAEKIINTQPDWLKNRSLYIIPSANPDAIDAFFAKTKFEKSGNNRLTDDDRNGKIADDIYDDLNNDGLITKMVALMKTHPMA
jgi:predicted deacylase